VPLTPVGHRRVPVPSCRAKTSFTLRRASCTVWNGISSMTMGVRTARQTRTGGIFSITPATAPGRFEILAGPSVPQNGNQPYGGAPDADILPLRIANSVVLFFTSAFAQAIQYAVQQKCGVVSISMVGLPSGVWNDAVNAAYEAGTCIVAASGDCLGAFRRITSSTRRVITARLLLAVSWRAGRLISTCP